MDDYRGTKNNAAAYKDVPMLQSQIYYVAIIKVISGRPHKDIVVPYEDFGIKLSYHVDHIPRRTQFPFHVPLAYWDTDP